MEGMHSTVVQADSRRPHQDAPCSTVHDVFVPAKIDIDYSLLPPQVFKRVHQIRVTQIRRFHVKTRRIFRAVVHAYQTQRNRSRTIRHESGLRNVLGTMVRRHQVRCVIDGTQKSERPGKTRSNTRYSQPRHL